MNPSNSRSETIVTGTLITASISAFATGLYGIFTGNPRFGLFAGAAGVNSGLTALTFFGIREYGISPLLVSTMPWPQYARRRRALNPMADPTLPQTTEKLTWQDIRGHNILDSGISGAITGGLIRGWKSGPRAIIPGALAASIFCVIFQRGVNELSVMRVEGLTSPPRTNQTPAASMSPSTAGSTWDRWLRALGLRQLPDEEYVAKMIKTREGYQKRIAELEQQMADEAKAKPQGKT